jgi:hypothetical protein
MIHKLELIKILFTVYELVHSVLEAVTLLFLSNLLLLLDDIMGFFKLLSLIFDLFFILTIFLKDKLFLLLHYFLFLLDNLLNSCLNTGLHLLYFITLADLTFL